MTTQLAYDMTTQLAYDMTTQLAYDMMTQLQGRKNVLFSGGLLKNLVIYNVSAGVVINDVIYILVLHYIHYTQVVIYIYIGGGYVHALPKKNRKVIVIWCILTFFCYEM